MSASSLKRTIIAISAALTLSAATIGATISPAQAGTIEVAGVARG
jgi:C4-dicarboxylate transporter